MIPSSKVTKLSGPPGTGKTTSLLDALESMLSSRVAPEDIIYTTFTRAGAYEARDRACVRFSLSPGRFPYFKTIHALCHSLMPGATVLTRRDWCYLASRLGLFFSPRNTTEESIQRSQSKGDYLLALWSLGRTMLISLEECFRDRNRWLRGHEEVTYQELEHFVNSVNAYKSTEGKIDFTDMLERYVVKGPDTFALRVIIDEAQDLSPLQWAVVEKISKQAEQVLIAGDDDQAIHEWNGASPQKFIALEAEEYRVLPVSYRVPALVHKLATQVSERIGYRLPKEYRPREALGAVERVASVNSLNLSKGHWLLLARNISYLETYVQHCIARGYLYISQHGALLDPEILQAIATWQRLTAGDSVPPAEVALMYRFMSQRDRVQRGMKKTITDLPKGSEPLSYSHLVSNHGLVAGSERSWDQALDMIPESSRLYLMKASKTDNIFEKPRIEISTIHGAKGRECDNVVLIPDMTNRTWESFEANPDQEHRVWYVGITRAKQTLTLVSPNNDNFYPL